MKVIGQSIVKANNDIYENGNQRKNEDNWYYKDNCIAVSDGAGGVGILADQWSKLLVEKIPDRPFKAVTEIDKWIGEFWEEFYKNYLKKMQDPWQVKKFEEEGSLATLTALWKTGKKEYIYESYGDSALFIYNKNTGELKIQENITSINYFGTSPALINWKTEEHDAAFFYTQKIDLKKDEEILIATDGIAMYIFGAYRSFKNKIDEEITENKMLKITGYFKENPIEDFKMWMKELKGSLNSEEAFKRLTKEWYTNKFLPNDDYTLVWIENEEGETHVEVSTQQERKIPKLHKAKEYFKSRSKNHKLHKQAKKRSKKR